MSEVVLKGEIHSSGGDLEEEREIVKDGVDVLILERDDPELESEYGWFDGWFQISVTLFFWFLESVYISKTVLVDLAEYQGADVVYTRETNAEMLDNAAIWAKLVGAGLFYIFLLVSLGIGVLSGPSISYFDLTGACILALAVGLPPLAVRVYNMRQSSQESNRDKIMANKISEAAEKDNRVVAIVGGAHLPGVKKHLPNEFNPTVHRPVYGICSYRHLSEALPRLFKSGLVVFSFYLFIGWMFSVLLEYYSALGQIL